MRRLLWALQDYYREGEGSLMQCVLTPADAYMPLTNEAIAAKVDKQVGSRVYLPAEMHADCIFRWPSCSVCQVNQRILFHCSAHGLPSFIQSDWWSRNQVVLAGA